MKMKIIRYYLKNSHLTMWTKVNELYDPQDGTIRFHTLATMFNMCV